MDKISWLWYDKKNEMKDKEYMKRFFKSLIISLCAGIPLAVLLIVFLYTNQKEDTFERIELDFSEETTVSEEEHIKQESIQQPEQAVETDVQSEEIIEPEQTKSSVTLAFAGDVHFSELVSQNYDNAGISAVVDNSMLTHMQNADFFMLNHEFVFSLRGEAMEDKEYTLRNDPKYVKILQELGTDAVTLANNHVLDFGQTAFLDTLQTLNEAKIEYTGGGYDLDDAFEPIVQTIGGQTFAIFAATRVSPSYDWYASSKRPGVFQTYDASALNKAIQDAEALYDHTIVYVHWGIERNEVPEEYQRTLAKGYIDAGTDLIIGAHPHVLQGFEYYNGVPIIYSLGNYLFGNRTGETLLLNAIFDESGKLDIQLIPCERVNGVLKKIANPEQLFSHLTDLSFGVTVSEDGILRSNNE